MITAKAFDPIASISLVEALLIEMDMLGFLGTLATSSDLSMICIEVLL